MSFVGDFNEQNPNNLAPPAARNLNASVLSRSTYVLMSRIKSKTLWVSKDSVTAIREKFDECGICQGSKVPWSARSPDLVLECKKFKASEKKI